MLCNLAPHPLDEAAAKLGRDTSRGVVVFRYADDLMPLAREPSLATSAVAALRRILKGRWQKFKAEPAPVPAASNGSASAISRAA